MVFAADLALYHVMTCIVHTNRLISDITSTYMLLGFMITYISFFCQAQQRPGPVDSLAASPRYTSVLLSWNSALIGNNIILIDITYEVEYHEPGEMNYIAVNVTETSTELTGLKPQTRYTISVTAYTSVGAGRSTTVEIMTMPISEC